MKKEGREVKVSTDGKWKKKKKRVISAEGKKRKGRRRNKCPRAVEGSWGGGYWFVFVARGHAIAGAECVSEGRKEGRKRGARAKFARGAALRREGEGREEEEGTGFCRAPRQRLSSVHRRAQGRGDTREVEEWERNRGVVASSLPELGNLTSLRSPLQSQRRRRRKGERERRERKKSQSKNVEFARTSEKKRIERDGFWKSRNHLSSSSWGGGRKDALTLCALECDWSGRHRLDRCERFRTATIFICARLFYAYVSFRE